MEMLKKHWVKIAIIGIIVYVLWKKNKDKKAETTTTAKVESKPTKATQNFIDGFLG